MTKPTKLCRFCHEAAHLALKLSESIFEKTKCCHVSGVPIVCLYIDGKERLCLAQISNTLLKSFSYNEIHNRRVALGITCVQCTPVQLEILRRAGAMPISSRRCGMITKREAERLVKSFLEDNAPPKLPENFFFEVEHNCGWGCRGRFEPSRYNSSRAKCIKCTLCNLFFSPNKFIFHFHRTPESKYNHPDAANFNSWRRHLILVPGTDTDDIMHAWEDVKAMFNGGSRKRTVTTSSSRFSHSMPSATESKKPKLHMDNSGIAKQTFPSQYPNYPMFSVPSKAYPFTPLAAHSQLGITFPFGKESSQPEPVKQSHGFGHTPWRSSSNFIFPSYDLLWANHFNMGNLNSPVTSFRPNMYETPSVKDLSLFSMDRHSPSDSANSTEDDDQEASPVGNNMSGPFNQSNQRLSAFKPVHKTDSIRHGEHVDIETVDDAKTNKEIIENSDIDLSEESNPVNDKNKDDQQHGDRNVHESCHNRIDKIAKIDTSRPNDKSAIEKQVVEEPRPVEIDEIPQVHTLDNNNEETKVWTLLRFELPHEKTNKMTQAPSEDSDQPGHPPSLISLRCPQEESLGLELPSERTAKTLIWLGGYQGWSESSLGAQSFCWFCYEAAHF